MRWSSANIERWLWYVFLATCAWQTRLILWHADATFVEWRAISLYGSDVLMAALFLFALTDRRFLRIRIRVSDLVLLGFCIAAFISLRNTDQLIVGLYQWGRLMQFVILFFYVRYRASRWHADASILAFVIGVCGQSILALAQYVLQHDIGLRWLGEAVLDPQMKGVAVFYDLAHVKILRAYGTLPHPNVLAAYVIVGLWALMYLYLRHAHDDLRKHRWIWGTAGVLLLWALYATYSRTMIAVGGIGTGALLAVVFSRPADRWPNIAVVRRRARHLILTAAIASAVFAGLFWRQIAARAHISPGEEAVSLRVYYARQALDSGSSGFLNLNWTGVGIGDFTTWLERTDPGHPPWMYQPAHNLYLLIYSETGIVGIGFFLVWLALIMRQAIGNTARPLLVRWGLVMVLASFLIIALFDHFFWTLQQGRILWWMILATVASRGILVPS
jgi:O-antigen ligase